MLNCTGETGGRESAGSGQGKGRSKGKGAASGMSKEEEEVKRALNRIIDQVWSWLCSFCSF